ncbi:hypothetical protein XA67_20450 [Comamonas thiooxydans]|nr:hypothetical protein XA67_20450 [Comamonas thiooxydans]
MCCLPHYRQSLRDYGLGLFPRAASDQERPKSLLSLIGLRYGTEILECEGNLQPDSPLPCFQRAMF